MLDSARCFGKSKLSRNTRPQACRAEMGFRPKSSGHNQFQSHLTGKAVIAAATTARAMAPNKSPISVVKFVFIISLFVILPIPLNRVKFPEPEPNFMSPFVLLPFDRLILCKNEGLTKPVG